MKHCTIADLTRSRVIRDLYADRVEVLDTVKPPVMIDQLDLLSVEGVAYYFNTSPHGIRNILEDKPELKDAGAVKLSRQFIQDNHPAIIVDKRQRGYDVRLSNGRTLTISNGTSWFLNRAAILRLAMMLTKSEVAKEIRKELIGKEDATMIKRNESNLPENEQELMDSRAMRDQYANRLDVLDKVKALFTIDKLDMLTIGQVAEYYEVEKKAIAKVFERARDEFLSDGARKLTTGEIPKSDKMSEFDKPLTNAQFAVDMTDPDHTVAIVRSGWFFPRRAILRMGMLLRDSAIAKEVRNQLLNVVEAAEEEKSELVTQTIDEESSLLLDIIRAQDDINRALAVASYRDFTQRHIRDLEIAVEQQKQENTALVDENDMLSAKNRTWSYRRITTSLVLAIANKINSPVSLAYYYQMYKPIESKLGISASRRFDPKKHKAKIDTIRPEEWPAVTAIVYANARELGVNTRLLLGGENCEKVEAGMQESVS